MTYIDGFVIAVPKANKQKFIDHANNADSMFIEMGALRVVECWGDDVPDGTTTDFRMAVKANDDEDVIFSWIEWADKEPRDKAYAVMMSPDFKDPRMDSSKNPMPFDGKRMIWGGFESIVDEFASGATGYVDGFVIPVPLVNKSEYLRVAAGSAPIFQDLGASRVVECWGDDVPHGTVTDFYRSVIATEDETMVFSWIEYPDKPTRDAARVKMMDDPRFAALGKMPFDGKRMIVAGFVPVVDLSK